MEGALQVLQKVLAQPVCCEYNVQHVLIAAGALAILRILLSILSFVFTYTVAPCCRARRWRKGEWAVVTGATDGIGKGYAVTLAKQGVNVVIISRGSVNPETKKRKLDEVADEVRKAGEKHGVKVHAIEADFSKTDIYPGIRAELEKVAGNDISLLVNNVGVSYPGALFFDELEKYEPGLRSKMIAMNVTSVVEMSALVLPGMLSRKRGTIINISSAAGKVPVGNPLYALYSGTKAAVDYFSRSLATEYAGKGIVVQCQIPYFVATKMSKIRTATLFAPSPRSFAATSLAAVGGPDSFVPYLPHALQDLVPSILPTPLLRSYLMSLHLGLRKAYFRKLEKAANAADASGAAAAAGGKGKKGE